MEFSKQSERWEDEQLQTLELALGFPPGTITAADIEYLIQRSYAAYDDSEDDDLCFSMQQQCRVSICSPPPPFLCLRTLSRSSISSSDVQNIVVVSEIFG